ncbi:restriction endonuclease subunit S [Cronobacter sakazakii]|jgi:type I restriction enzyme S subunit|uniref:restriction endonuclease subunit S n=1 Tax=Enterobacteriaceae TaxID=543 RepID=UPI000DA1416D|nr:MULTISPECIES: restriction endonuclease subunit S [Enterobacteriaceae]MBG5995837.1 restriction endonuclease subunit S [Proteus mirabilis]ELY2493569.1 restriction endonuclease subunit S [Cronobacter sakazakii]ELY4327539.1 restriction endonuclease subunit S [Cronobacter sakazakii]ELY4765119.1 restriction endonuclease subunit S [Cronobacter sakazakii]ELY4851399.1 restriction endonuclease subunit S [Cronobacter sakazakii]
MEQVLYKLPDGWEWHSVKKLSHNIQYGHTAKAESNGNAKFLRITDIQDGKIDWQGVPTVSLEEKEISKYALNDDDLIFARSGATAGKSILIKNAPKDAVFASYLIRIVPNKKDIIPEYLSYFFLTPAYWEVVGQNAAGAAQPNINGTKLSEFIVPVAPQGEQKRIVEKLDALLTRIDTAIEHLQESVTLADALSKNGLSEIFESLKDRYEVVPLSSVVKINSGIALPKLFKNGFSDGDIPFFKVAQMNNHHETMVAPEITFNETVAKEHKIKLFPKGSTLIPKRGGAILTNKKRMLLEDASYDSNIMGLKADESKISDEYLFAFMRTIDLANFVDASTIPQVNNKHIDQMQIPLASIEEQADVVSRVNLLVKKVETMNSEIQRQLDDLQALKSSILDSAFKGEL